jgi:hypothetical protein
MNEPKDCTHRFTDIRWGVQRDGKFGWKCSCGADVRISETGRRVAIPKGTPHRRAER